MARNIEIKARLDDFERTADLAKEISRGEPELIVQQDVFFHCRHGRLKLRIFTDGTGELIAYERADQSGPKTSSYTITPVSDPPTMQQALDRSVGTRAIVRKRRYLYLAGRTRIHLDRVDRLGDFLELEVVMQPDEQESIGISEARELMSQLEVSEASLVDAAYVDLQEQL